MFQCEDFPWQLYIGKEVQAPRNLYLEIAENTKEKFDFLVVPLFHRRFSASPDVKRQVPATRGAYALTSDGWARHIIGKVSFLIDPDVQDITLRTKWENELIQ
jgi:hypothetical protein